MMGFNPLRHNCETQGCFNKNRRPKIEVFAGCFPGAIAMADIDGFVEIRGRFLYLEWKSPGAPLHTAQRISYTSLSRTTNSIVILCWGNAESMDIGKMAVFVDGVRHDFSSPSLESAKLCMQAWATAAKEGRNATLGELMNENLQPGFASQV